MDKLKNQRIGKCGELIVQYTLLRHGVDSAPMTTDPGIDLIAFKDIKKKPVTIQVKTSTHHSEQGGTPDIKWIEWWVSDDCPAEYIAAVDYDRQKCWIFKIDEFRKLGSRSSGGHRLYWYVLGYDWERTKKKEEKFKSYEIDTEISKIF